MNYEKSATSDIISPDIFEETVFFGEKRKDSMLDLEVQDEIKSPDVIDETVYEQEYMNERINTFSYPNDATLDLEVHHEATLTNAEVEEVVA